MGIDDPTAPLLRPRLVRPRRRRRLPWELNLYWWWDTLGVTNPEIYDPF